MQGMYGGLGIARLLEASPAYRASDDRAMLDDVLLWTAHEIGADFEEKPVFNEQPVEKARRLGDRARRCCGRHIGSCPTIGAGGRSLKLHLLENLGRRQHAFSGLVRTPSWSWCGSPIRSRGEKPSDLEAQTQGRRIRLLGC